MKKCAEVPPKVLAIAGSDPSGGAGIQADIKSITMMGCYASTAVTALTVQNTKGVSSIFPIPEEVVAAQIEAVMEDIKPQAIKIGMVKGRGIVETIVAALKRYRPAHIVYDPVMVATSGDKLIDEDVTALLEETLIPISTLITPNLAECRVLYGGEISNMEQMEQAAIVLATRYNVAVLVKGGHLDGELMEDILAYRDGDRVKVSHFTGRRIDTKNLHGTGCTLSSAIAANLAKGMDVVGAVKCAKSYVTEAIEMGSRMVIGEGNGPLWHPLDFKYGAESSQPSF